MYMFKRDRTRQENAALRSALQALRIDIGFAFLCFMLVLIPLAGLAGFAYGIIVGDAEVAVISAFAGWGFGVTFAMLVLS